MPVKMRLLMAVCLVLVMVAQAAPVHAQNSTPTDVSGTYTFGSTARGALGRPQAFGRLLVKLEVVPTCTISGGDIRLPVSIRCTRGVTYRTGILTDTDQAFSLTQAFAPRPTRSHELVRVEAERLDVEF